MSTRRIPSLDGLRAISITMVMLAHLSTRKQISLGFLGGYGSLGVYVFFVLSGYLITSILLREQERSGAIKLKTFYLRRAFRIFPGAFVFLAVVTVLYWGKIGWFHVAAAAFYVTNMETTTPWILAHLWSVSIEEQFYLLWPFALKKWHRDKTAILIGVFSLTPFFSAGLYAFKIHNGMASSLPVYADKLAIGCLLAIFAPRLPRIGKPLAVLMLFAALLIPWFPSISAARSLFMLFVLRPLLDLCLAGLLLHVIQIPYRFLNWAPVAWLGKISYSLYLWQQLFCFSPSLHLGYLLIVPAIACACLSYYCIEQPMLRVRERFQRNHGQPEPPVPSSTPATNPELAASIP